MVAHTKPTVDGSVRNRFEGVYPGPRNQRKASRVWLLGRPATAMTFPIYASCNEQEPRKTLNTRKQQNREPRNQGGREAPNTANARKRGIKHFIDPGRVSYT